LLIQKKRRVIHGNEAEQYVKSIARRLKIDLAKADEEKTEKILSKGSSLSSIISAMRNRKLNE
jgi:hypothetical protein